MTRLLFICLCAIITTSIVALKCGPNQVIDECPSVCPSDHCPKDEHQDSVACKKPARCPPAKCKCQFNYRFAENGTCIPTTDCPPFVCNRENERYSACQSYCPTDDCSQATPDGRCPYPGLILIVVNCRPKCQCIEGHWRHNGKCVPYSQCPQNIDGITNDFLPNRFGSV